MFLVCRPQCHRILSRHLFNSTLAPAHVIALKELATSEAKWITLNKIEYKDFRGNKRTWECASRRTRKSEGIDAVAVLPILRSKTGNFPISTVIIEQFRPPVNKMVIELPAGLVDEGETPEQAAFRELEEETGYKASTVIDISPITVCDPGMTDANMRLVTLGVELDKDAPPPKQNLQGGEHIMTRIVPLDSLASKLKEYEAKGFVVDARLSHYAAGYDLARNGFAKG